MESKTCCKCKQSKPLSEFHLNRRNAGGLHSYCKVCNIKQTKERNQREKERKFQKREQARLQCTTNHIAEKICPACKVKKSTAEFYFDSRRTDGLLAYCRDCSKAIVQERKIGLSGSSRKSKTN